MAHFQMLGKKINVAMFEGEFFKHAVNGFIGDPEGLDAYGYVRVSTPAQAMEDRSGILRQIENIHIASKRRGIRISWDMVFGDDESGYFLERPALKELLNETLRHPRGKFVVFEDIKRLSRSWRWHQGYLFEQFEEIRGMEVVFFTEASSDLERVFQGYAADMQAQYSNEIMREGKRRKAAKGFITACSIPLFGYMRVDPDGLVSARTQRETKYTPRPAEATSQSPCRRFGEAAIALEIFESLVYGGVSARQLAIRLMEKYGPPGRAKTWDSSYIGQMVANSAYYGDYISNRFFVKFVHEPQPDGTIKKKKVTLERPESEWIHVKIEQPIVSKELWLLANEVLEKNKLTASRNTKNGDYLLTGMLKCAECGYAWNAIPVRNRKGATPLVYYRCTSVVHRKIRKNYGVECSMKESIQAAVLEKAVWEMVKKIVYQPEVLLKHLDEQFVGEANQETQNQLAYITRSIEDAKNADSVDRELLNAGYMQLHEYGPKHLATMKKIAQWEEDIRELERKLVSPENLETRKAQLLLITEQARKYEQIEGEVPIEMKKALLKMAITTIYLDSHTGMMKIEGVIGPQVLSFLPTEEGNDTNGKGGKISPLGSLYTFVLLASFLEGTIQTFRLLTRV